MSNRPPYEALDAHGYPYMRQAHIVADLPSPEERQAALDEAASKIAGDIGVSPTGCIPFGGLVADAFMTRAKAKEHPRAALLLIKGDCVSLDHCSSYN